VWCRGVFFGDDLWQDRMPGLCETVEANGGFAQIWTGNRVVLPIVR